MHRRDFIAITVFLLGLFVIDRGLGLALDAALSRVTTGDGSGGMVNWALENSDRKCFVFGSSRAKHHVDPRVLSDELGLSTINVALDGQGIQFATALEALILRHGTEARLFVLQINPEEMYEPSSGREMVAAPFFGRAPIADDILKSSSTFAFVKIRSHAYRYNSMALPIVRNLLWPGRRGIDGFEPCRGTSDDFPPDESYPSARQLPLRAGRLELVRVFIREARKRDIDVVLVISPRLRRLSPDADSAFGEAMERLGEVASEEGALFAPVTEFTHPELRDPALFRDAAHLNEAGAHLFSRLLATEIKGALPGSPDPG